MIIQFIFQCSMEKLLKLLKFVVFASAVLVPARSQNAKSFTIGDEPSDPSQHLDSRIVFGTPAGKDQFPFYALLVIVGANITNICGGSLISPNFIVTAAHCMRDANKVWILMGSNDRIGFSDIRLASTISIHPDYNFTTANNDIAIVKSDDPLNYTKIALPTANTTVNYAGAKMITIGFGRNENGNNPRYLYFTEIIGFSDDQCKSVYPFYKSDIMMCGKSAGRSSICSGDSGGPLVLDNVLVGVNGFVKTPSCIDNVDGFARVNRYVDWINNQISTL